MTTWPVHGRISGPIVMIGFGSIGRGTLPLIERHFDFDRSRMAVIDPVDTRTAVGTALRTLRTKTDPVVARKHDSMPC